MKRNISINYLYTIFQYLVVTGLWVLYLSQKGFSTIEIGLLEALFHGTSFLFEVPSGSLGDRFGYRNTLIASRLVSILSCLLIVTSSSFWLIALGFVCNALSYNLASGTNEALVFESLLAEKKSHRYLPVSANINMLIEIFSSAGIVVAGLFSDWFFDGVYWIQILLNLVAIGIAWQFKEPPRKKVQQKKYLDLMKSAFTVTRAIPGLLVVMLAFAFLDGVYSSYYFYFQSYFDKLGLAGLGISIVLVISAVFQTLGAKFAPIISKYFSLSQIFLGELILFAIAIGCSGFLPPALTIMCYILTNTLSALLNPIRSNYINQLIPSEERATINSIDSLCFSLMMIPLFPIAGGLIAHVGYALTFALLAVIVSLGGIIAYSKLGKVFPKKDSKYEVKQD